VAVKIKSNLFRLWTEKELREGRIITIDEVAQATGLNAKSVGALKRGTPKRFDKKVLERLSDYFDVGDGALEVLVVTRTEENC